LYDEQKTVAVREVIAEIETDASIASTAESSRATAIGAGIEPPKPQPQKVTPQSPPRPAPSQRPTQKVMSAPGRFYSPLVLSIARQEGISMAELERISGTGEGGRVSKKDLLAYVEAKKKSVSVPVLVAQRQQLREEAAQPVASQPATKPSLARVESTLKRVDTEELLKRYPASQYEVLQMSNVLQRMAEHMTNTVRTSPHVWAVHECDMTSVEKARRRNMEAFEKREGFKLTYTPFVCESVINALKEFPLVNSSVEGDKIVLKKFVNLGIAVASENGLIVPVIKNADEKNFVGLARSVNDLASRTRTKRLSPSDIEGGSFTITNYGVFGTKIGVPLINQPQVAILGTGAITKQPVVINDAIAIRSIANFTLAFDHRIVDGALAGYFLEAIIKYLESYDENVVL
jgi:pyruvate/2-oxoglutarate dehydrogenase complex dihydrolipoamide acyltransferase (E2) component